MKKKLLILIFFILFIFLIVLLLYKLEKNANQIPFEEEDKTEEVINNNLPQSPKEEISERPKEVLSEIENQEKSESESTLEEKIVGESEKEEFFFEKNEISTINIPYCKSLFHKIEENNQLTPAKLTLNQEERSLLKIDNIILNVDFGNLSENQFCKGKTYYNGVNGRLESIIIDFQDETIHEYLISYNSEGEYKNCIEIGILTPQNEKKKYAVLSGRKLSIYESLSQLDAKKTKETVTEYYISPQLELKKGKTFSKID